MPALHAISGSQLNRITPSVESYLDAEDHQHHRFLGNMPKADPRSSFSRQHRADPYPTMNPHTGSSSPRRESITSTSARGRPADGAAHERPSTAWSPEDDSRLMDLRKQNLNWGPVAENFPGKTSNACRKRHERLMERKHTTEYDGVRIEELSSAYFECREQMWRILADFLKEPRWQTLENKCFGQGLKNLQTAARQQRTRSVAGGRGFSPSGASHASDAVFDDSGLGHSPPETISMLPMPVNLRTTQSPPRGGSLRTSRENSSPFHGQGMEAPAARPPILSVPVANYNYPSAHFANTPGQGNYANTAGSYAHSGGYGMGSSSQYAPVQPVSLPPPNGSGNQTLPSLTRTFNVHELPPVTAGYGSRHVSATYG